MKIVHWLFFLVMSTVLMLNLILFSIIQSQNVQEQIYQQFAQVSDIETQIDLLHQTTRQVSQQTIQQRAQPIATATEPPQHRDYHHTQHRYLTQLLYQLQAKTVFQQQALAQLTALNQQMSKLSQLDAAQRSPLFRSMTETLFQYKSDLIQYSRDRQQFYFYLIGSLMLGFILLFIFSAHRSYQLLQTDLAAFRQGIKQMLHDKQPPQLASPHYGELQPLTRAFNQMCVQLNQASIQKDQLIHEITLQSQHIQQQQRELRYLADHDDLTGLFSRNAFRHLLEVSLNRCQRNSQQAALLFLDLDKFKLINDHFGHAAGDAVLMRFSQRLAQNLRKSDIIARIGGDEFVILIEPFHHEDELSCLANKLQHALSLPMEYEGKQLQLGVSLGLSVFPQHGDNFEELLLHADTAMYEAKRYKASRHLQGASHYDAFDQQTEPVSLAQSSSISSIPIQSMQQQTG